MDLKDILRTVRINATNNYDNDKILTNTDEGKEMIYFSSKTIDCKKVNDWGRDEDTDLFIGLDKSGWILYTQVSHNLAGPFKIISENVLEVDDDYLANYFNSQNSTNKEFMQFIGNAAKYYSII